MNNQTIKTGDASPWGRIDWVQEWLPGVVAVQTPSHGGFFVSREAAERMPIALYDLATFVERNGQASAAGSTGRWYEEDCDWSIVALAFPERFNADQVRAARTIAIRYYGAPVARWLDSLSANHPAKRTPSNTGTRAPLDYVNE